MNRAEQLRRAVKQANLPSYAVVVYDALLSPTDWATATLPDARQPRSVIELAEWAGLSRSYTLRALALLERYGWIERKPPAILRRGLSTTYQVQAGRKAPARRGEPLTDAQRARRYRQRKRERHEKRAPMRHETVDQSSVHINVTKAQVNNGSAQWAVVGGVSGDAALQDQSSPGNWAGGFAGVPACADAIAAVDDLAAEWERGA